jgi:hypothetical protein
MKAGWTVETALTARDQSARSVEIERNSSIRIEVGTRKRKGKGITIADGKVENTIAGPSTTVDQSSQQEERLGRPVETWRAEDEVASVRRENDKTARLDAATVVQRAPSPRQESGPSFRHNITNADGKRPIGEVLRSLTTTQRDDWSTSVHSDQSDATLVNGAQSGRRFRLTASRSLPPPWSYAGLNGPTKSRPRKVAKDNVPGSDPHRKTFFDYYASSFEQAVESTKPFEPTLAQSSQVSPLVRSEALHGRSNPRSSLSSNHEELALASGAVGGSSSRMDVAENPYNTRDDTNRPPLVNILPTDPNRGDLQASVDDATPTRRKQSAIPNGTDVRSSQAEQEASRKPRVWTNFFRIGRS